MSTPEFIPIPLTATRLPSGDELGDCAAHVMHTIFVTGPQCLLALSRHDISNMDNSQDWVFVMQRAIFSRSCFKKGSLLPSTAATTVMQRG